MDSHKRSSQLERLEVVETGRRRRWSVDVTGFLPARTVHIAAQLGIADLLADEAQTAEALAREKNVAVVPLRRLLRALASMGAA